MSNHNSKEELMTLDTETTTANDRREGDEGYRYPDYAWSVGFRIKGGRTVKTVAEYLSWAEASEMSGEMLAGWPTEAGMSVYYFHYETTIITSENGRASRFQVKAIV
jgi:hypothetical protein